MIINVFVIIALISIVIYIVRLDKNVSKLSDEHFDIESTVCTKNMDTENMAISNVSFKSDDDKKNFRNTINFENQCEKYVDKYYEKYFSKHFPYILNRLFPIGYIYITASPEKPEWMNNWGQWKQIGKDRARFLVSVSGVLQLEKKVVIY